MIKRITAAALLLCMCLFFCACGEAQQSSLTPYEELYLQRAEELLAAGDRDTAIAALEEGISATGSEALKNRLNEIRGTDSAEGEASDSNVSDSSPSDLSTDAATSDLSSTDANSSQASSQAADDLPTATQQTPSDASSDAGTSENPADNSYAAYCGFYKTENYDDVEISDLGNGVLRFVKTGERGSLSGTLNAEDIVKNKGIVTLADEVGTSFDVIFEFSDGSVLMDGVSLIPFDLSAATLDFEGFFVGTNVTLENVDWYLTYRRNTCYPVL